MRLAADRIKALSERVAELEAAGEVLRREAAMLAQSAIGCAVNHYGEDFQRHGLPGWLRDRKSTRLNPVTNAHLVCRLLLEKKNQTKIIIHTHRIANNIE